MKRIIISLVVFFLTAAAAAVATPYYPGGVPSIGPLKGGNTFWGRTDDGKYFEGTGYYANYEIKLPNKEILFLDINARTTNYQERGTESSHSFSIRKGVKNFSGKFNLCILNPGEEVIKKQYEGKLNIPETGSYFTNYQPFDFKKVQKNAKIALELLLNNGKTVHIPIDNKTSEEWIFIARQFPGTDKG